MESPHVLLIGEVANLLRVSIPTINRWLRQSRMGQRVFPLPINTHRGKLRWLRTDIEKYIESLSVTTPPVIPTTRKKQRGTKEYQEHQASVDRALERYRGKGNQ